MFWNEPNPYGYTHREVPNLPTPFFGQTLPKFLPFAMTPWTTPQIPPVTPFYGMNFPQAPQIPQIPPVTPFYGMNFPQVPQIPQIPQIPPVTPFYGMNFPQVPQIPQIPPVTPFYGMNFPVNPLTQFPQPTFLPMHPLALYGLPYRPF